MDWTTLAAFAAAWGLLVLLPGPDTALAISRALVRGRGAGLEAVAGSMTALAVHVTAAGLGLSALLASSATAFTIVKLVGAAYLVILGLRLILADHDAANAELTAPSFGLRNGYAQAVLTGLLNPKSALFFLTFLPQFLDRSAPATPQLLALGTITLILAASWAVGVVLVADRIRATLERPHLQARIERLTGTIFVVFGTRLVSTSR